MDPNDPKLKSFIQVPRESHFPIQNLPYGVFTTPANYSPRVGVAIGDQVLDLSVLEQAELLDVVPGERLFNRETLNPFIERGPDAWRRARSTISELLQEKNARLRDDARLRARAFTPQSAARMLMPVAVSGYTDFYSSKEHATNVGSMFRDPQHALLPNWLYVPIAYNGRASSIVVTGTPVLRPNGQTKPTAAKQPVFGPSRKLDFELEIGCIVGVGNAIGEPVPIDAAASRLFGMVLLNDWSARDLQQWEYIPLGPFNSKTFATSISPWVVTMEALQPFRVEGPVQDPAPLPYLATSGPQGYDIHLEAALATAGQEGDDDLADEFQPHVLERRAAGRAPHGVGMQSSRGRPDWLWNHQRRHAGFVRLAARADVERHAAAAADGRDRTHVSRRRRRGDSHRLGAGQGLPHRVR